jgi:hypothetical protein
MKLGLNKHNLQGQQHYITARFTFLGKAGG